MGDSVMQEVTYWFVGCKNVLGISSNVESARIYLVHGLDIALKLGRERGVDGSISATTRCLMASVESSGVRAMVIATLPPALESRGPVLRLT
jgi:hypothetical protein